MSTRWYGDLQAIVREDNEAAERGPGSGGHGEDVDMDAFMGGKALLKG